MNDHKIIETWFDETRLEGVKLSVEDKKPGGPGGPVPPSRDPVR